MCHTGVDRIDILTCPDSGGGDIARQNDGHDETVNTDNSRHDDGDDIFHDRAGMTNASVEETDARFPCSPLF